MRNLIILYSIRKSPYAKCICKLCELCVAECASENSERIMIIAFAFNRNKFHSHKFHHKFQIQRKQCINCETNVVGERIQFS